MLKTFNFQTTISFFLLILGGSPVLAGKQTDPKTSCVRSLNVDERQTIQQSESELKILNLSAKISQYQAELDKYSDNRRAVDSIEDIISSTHYELVRVLKKATEEKQISDSAKEQLALKYLNSGFDLIPILKLNNQQSENLITNALNSPYALNIQYYLGSLELSSERKNEIAKTLLKNRHRIWRYLRETQTSADELIKTWLPIGLEDEGTAILQDNAFFDKLSKNDQSKLARAIGPKIAYGTAMRILAGKKILSQEDLDFLAIEDFRRSSDLLVDNEYLKFITPELLSTVKTFSVLNSNLKSLSRLLSINLGFAVPASEIKTKLNDNMAAYWPEIKQFLPSLFGRVSNQKVVLTLLASFLKQLRFEIGANRTFESKEQVDTLIATANQKLHLGLSQESLFSLLTGIPKKSIDQIKSKNLLRDLYLVVLDIQDKLDTSFSEALGLKFSDHEELTGEQLLKLSVVIRDRLDLGDSIENIRETNMKNNADVIDAQTIEKLVDQHQDHLFKTISQNLHMNKAPTKNEIVDLETRWNGLDPLLTVFSRYKSNADWNQLLPSLGKSFEQSLKHTFRRFKFFGDSSSKEDQAKARKQISMLKTEDEIRAWTQKRTKVKAFEGKPIVPNISDLTNEVSEIVKTNILGELELETNLLRFEDRDLIYHLLNQREGTRKLMDDFVISNSKSQNPERVSFEKLVFALHQYTPTDIKSLGKLLALTRIALDRSKDSFSEDELNNIRNNFDDIDARIKSWSRMGNNRTIEGLIVTTLNSDPKFLMTIGDLVESYSCQNYRTGSHIQSLMGYVIDANVQGLASFFIGPESFASPHQYQSVVEAAKTNTLKPFFDGNKRSLTLKFSQSDQSITIDLPKALYRSMVKLGVTPEGKTGLKMERAYTPSFKSDYLNSGLNNALFENAKELFKALVKDLHATSEGSVLIFGSRSPGGMYSDSAGGVKIGDYVIQE